MGDAKNANSATQNAGSEQNGKMMPAKDYEEDTNQESTDPDPEEEDNSEEDDQEKEEENDDDSTGKDGGTRIGSTLREDGQSSVALRGAEVKPHTNSDAASTDDTVEE